MNHLIYEIVDNAVDESIFDCYGDQVTLEKDRSATISDNGRGVPVDLHATGVFTGAVMYIRPLHAEENSMILLIRPAEGFTVSDLRSQRAVNVYGCGSQP